MTCPVVNPGLMLVLFCCLPTREWPVPSTSYTRSWVVSLLDDDTFAYGSSLPTGHVCLKPLTNVGRMGNRARQPLETEQMGLPLPHQSEKQTDNQTPSGSQEETEDLGKTETCRGPTVCEWQSLDRISGPLTPTRALSWPWATSCSFFQLSALCRDMAAHGQVP